MTLRHNDDIRNETNTSVTDSDIDVLMILGHPREPSLCAALAEAYAEGARHAGVRLETLRLSTMEFDPDVHTVSPVQQPLEPDLVRARNLIDRASHLVLVWPAWWGTGPARLKGLLDRVLLPGFAFRERDDGSFEGLLKGKTAHLILTMDMPRWVYRVIFRSPGVNAMKRSALGFCGITTTRTLVFGPVKDSAASDRKRWIGEAQRLGQSLRYGVRSRSRQFFYKLSAWLKALRLQFYPMTWIAYTVGALGAAATSGSWDLWLYLIGFLFLFTLEAATVFTNEWFDFQSDRDNRLYGPFNGGSRVLVDGLLTFREMKAGIVVSLLLALVSGGWIIASSDRPLTLLLMILVMGVSALGYTIPPLKLSWRGLGELDVGFTHSIGAILCGHLFLGASWSDPLPWLVSIPLFLSIMPAIILSGVPDLEADRAAGKRTLPVRLGRRRAKQLALLLTCAAAVSALLLSGHPLLQEIYGNILFWVLPHGLLLALLLYIDQKRNQKAAREDRLMVLSLSYIFWFGLIPLINLI